FRFAKNTDDLFVGKTLLHGDVLMWLMKTLLTSGCINQRGAGHFPWINNHCLMFVIICISPPYSLNVSFFSRFRVLSYKVPSRCKLLGFRNEKWGIRYLIFI
ncbi:hypothetical protein EIC82_14350, partial [Enterobacter sp. A11]